MDILQEWNSNSFGGGGGSPFGDGDDNNNNNNNNNKDNIFRISKVEYKPPHPVVHLVTSNNILVMALDNSHIIRLDLRDPSELEDIEIARKPEQIKRLFLDPQGNHLIISTIEENFYLHRSWKGAKKPRPLSKAKGIIIESVAWDLENTNPVETGTILIGTSTGLIFEANIEAKDINNPLQALKGGLEKVWKQVYNLQAASSINSPGSGGGSGSPGLESSTASSLLSAPVAALTGVGNMIGGALGTGGGNSGTTPPSGGGTGFFPSKSTTSTASSSNTSTGLSHSIQGIAWFRFPTISSGASKYCVLVSTNSRLYQFVGLNSFEQLFAHYQELPDHQDFPAGALRKSELSLFIASGASSPKSVSWLTGPGLFMADVLLASQNAGELVLENSAHLPYPTLSSMGSGGSGGGGNNNKMNLGGIDIAEKLPQSVILTEFHYVLLYANGSIYAISRITNETVYEGRFPVHSEMVGLAHDHKTGVIFAYSQHHIFEIHIDHEDKNVWSMYLSKSQYGLALQYCKEAWQKDRVWSAQADYYFQQKQFELAAQYFGKTAKSFEEITLRFIHIGEHDALRSFLKEKLSHMQSKDEMQMTIICTWLTELYLSKLNQLEGENILKQANSNQSTTTTTSNNLGMIKLAGRGGESSTDSRQGTIDMILEEFRSFLEEYSKLKVLDPATTFNLISSHGRTKELLHYAGIIKDYDKVIGYHIQQQNYDMALEVLTQLKDARLFYKYCPVLMQYNPYKTVNVLMSVDKELLDPRLLIPALMRYKYDLKQTTTTIIPTTSTTTAPSNRIIQGGGGAGKNTSSSTQAESNQHQAIRYLQYCVHSLRSKDTAIHNYLLSLYAQSEGEDADAQLLSFLKAKDTCFDLEYALRLCTKHNKQRACVLIFSKMGLYEEAVDLALSVDIELAKQNADMPETDNDTKKKLWLRIARHVVEEEKDITKAMKFLHNSDLLKIEDILPFFPDFVLIDDFKEEICKSLQSYNKHIEDLEHEMDSATKSAEAIRLDIDNLKNKYGFVSGNQACEICKFPVLTRSFLLFPCQHVFHKSCCINEAKKNISSTQVKRVNELQDQIRGKPAAVAVPSSLIPGMMEESYPSSSSGGGGSVALTQLQISDLQEELDKLVAGECPLCGELMIKSISRPFSDEATQKDLAKSWAID